MRASHHETWKCIKRDWRLYVFLLIPVAYILIFAYYPMLGIQIAFKKYSAVGGIWGSKWVGLANFQKFFKSYQFQRVLANTLRLSLYSLVFGFPVPILFALLANTVNSARYKKITQTIVNLPHFISVVVLVSMVNQVFGSRTGLYGLIGQALTGSYPPDLFADANSFQHLYIWSGVWQSTGWGTVIYMAALSGIDQNLYEAAVIDGASRMQQVRHVTLPGLAPTIVLVSTLSLSNVLNAGFDQIYNMYNPLIYETVDIIDTFTYRLGLVDLQFSLSTAVGLFKSVVSFLLISLSYFLAYKTTGYRIY